MEAGPARANAERRPAVWHADDPVTRAVVGAASRTRLLGLAALDADGRLSRANEAFGRLVGAAPSTVLGRTLAEVLPGLGDRLQYAVLTLLNGAAARPDAPQELDLQGRTPAGDEVAWSASLCRLPDDAPDGAAVALCLVDRSTEHHARRASSRLELLHRAAELMASSLEPARTLEHFCDLLVPALGDHAFVDLHDGDTLRRVAIRHSPGLTVDTRLMRPPGLPAAYAPDHPVQLAFTEGRELLVEDVDLTSAAIPHGKDTEFFRAVGVTSVIVLPLRQGAQVLGTLVLACSASGRHYDSDDLDLVRQLTGQAGSAVANALSFAAQRSAAVELQRSLLPQALDPVEGLDVAWRYVPGTDGTEVGGDWADVVELPGGRVAVVVGDVMGRGLRAAAVMGQLRTAVRTLAMSDPPPSDLLTQLDSIVAGLGADQIVTCVYGVFDPARGTLTLANAGHLPPLLVLDGRCHPLEGVSAVPLGVGGVEFTEREVPMPRGTLLALYTDGLVERRGGDLEAAVGRLGEVLLESRGSLTERAGAVLMQAAPTGPAGFTDDVALLLLQAQADPASRAAHHVLPATATSVGQARQAAAAALGDWGLDDEELATTVELLVSELVTNAVRYAAGVQVDLLLHRGTSALWIEVGDRDTRSPRMRHASPDDEGGRGLALVTALSEAWGARSTRDGKVVWVRLDLRHGVAPAVRSA